MSIIQCTQQLKAIYTPQRNQINHLYNYEGKKKLYKKKKKKKAKLKNQRH